jgi:hypothetical protein
MRLRLRIPFRLPKVQLAKVTESSFDIANGSTVRSQSYLADSNNRSLAATTASGSPERAKAEPLDGRAVCLAVGCVFDGGFEARRRIIRTRLADVLVIFHLSISYLQTLPQID